MNMEYRRRRRKKRRNRGFGYSGYSGGRASGQSEGSGFWGALLIILLTAGLIYLLIGTSVGTLIVQNVFKSCSNNDRSTPAPQVSGGPTSSPSLSGEISADICFSNLEVFVLQMGVYSDAGTADGLISSLKALGAAGYVLDTGSGHKVLASCYDTEAAARSVCDRLRTQGYECMVSTLSCEGTEISVKCSEAVMDSIKTAVSYASSLITSLSKEVIGFDAESRSIEYGRAVVGEMLTNVKTIRSSISGFSDPSGVISKLDEYYMQLEAYMTTFISSSNENRVEVSGMLKYLQLDVVCSYINLVNSVRNP